MSIRNGEVRFSRLKSVRHPQHIVAIAMDDTGIVAKSLELDGTLYLPRGDDIHISSTGLWDSPISLCSMRSTTWVMGWSMYHILCECGMYQAFEGGKISLPKRGTDKRSTISGNDRRQLYGSLVCSDPPTIIDVLIDGKRKVKFVDLANYGLERRMFAGDDDWGILSDTIEAIQTYHNAVVDMGMGSLQVTAAAQGMSWYRQSRDCEEIVCNQDEDTRRHERASWYGGRNECYSIGVVDNQVHYIDYTSMYSSIAIKQWLPTRLTEHTRRVDLSPPKKIAEHSCCIATVLIESDNPSYPVRIGGHVYYPVGRYVTTLCGPELYHAAAAGVIHRYIRIDQYDMSDAMSQWASRAMDCVSSLDDYGYSHIRSAIKLAINCTYGSLGKRGRLWVDTPPDGVCCKWGQWWIDGGGNNGPTQARSVDGQYQVLHETIEPTLSSPYIPAWIASYCRVHMRHLMNCIGIDNIYYMDTDGMIVNDAGLRVAASMNGFGSGSPGTLSVRESGDRLIVRGLKDYTIGEHWVQAGVPESASRGVDGRATWEAIEPWEYGLWHKEPWANRMHTRSRMGYSPYRAGIVDSTGRVSPIYVDCRQEKISGKWQNGIASDAEMVYHDIM